MILYSMVLADFGFLICCFLYIEAPLLIRLLGNASIKGFFDVYLFDVSLIGVNIFEMSRNWITTLIAVWRFVATNYPLKAKLCLRGRGFTVIILVFFLSIISRGPIIFSRITKTAEKANSTRQLNTDFNLSTLAVHIHNMVDLFLLATLPISIILLCK